ncbi:MAG: lantibiotic dehydratase [Myxococcota bacterium]
MDIREFAPFGVLRVASWPIETLQPFGNADLFDDARSARLSTKNALNAFDKSYQHVLFKERQALWQMTAGNSRFMKALALHNPTLMQRVQKYAGTMQGGVDIGSNKRIRHLETTLYRLLARAVGRTEPLGAWCGVSLVDFGGRTHLQSAPVQRFVAPDLLFFAAVLRALTQNPKYRRLACYRINPTLGRQSDGSWGYWAPPSCTQQGYATLATNPTLEAALERLANLPQFLISEAESALSVEPHTLDGFFFEQLIPQGILLGGWSLPAFYSDPWNALCQIESDIPADDRGAWKKVRHTLDDICRSIEDNYDALNAQELAKLAAGAAQSAGQFATELNIDSQALPTLGLHVDCSAPFKLTLGADFVSCLRHAVASDEADVSGSMRAFNESLRRVQCEQLGERGIPLDRLHPRNIINASESAHWPRIRPQDYFADWPLRSLIVNLVDTMHAEPSMSRFSLLDDAASLVSRFLPILSRCSGQGSAALTNWLRMAHQNIGPIHLAALGEPDTHVPNAAAQPDLGLPRFTLWGTHPQVRHLSNARLVGLTDCGLVSIDVDGQRHALTPLTAVNLVRDPVMQLILMSSFHFPKPMISSAPDVDYRASREDKTVHEGDMQNPLSVSCINQIVKQRGVHRYVAWCAAVSSYRTWALEQHANLSDHAIVRRRGVPDLLITLSSPLAISALLEGATSAAGSWELQTLAQPYLSDERGHFVSQLVVPFRRLEPGKEQEE